jgi:hypothetical protein
MPNVTIPNAICFAPTAPCPISPTRATGQFLRQRLGPTDGWPEGKPEVWWTLRPRISEPRRRRCRRRWQFLERAMGRVPRRAATTPDGRLTETRLASATTRALARGDLGRGRPPHGRGGLTWVRIGEFAWSRLEPDARRSPLRLARPRHRHAGRRRAEGRARHAHRDAAALDAGPHPDMLAVDAEGARAVRLAPALLLQP